MPSLVEILSMGRKLTAKDAKNAAAWGLVGSRTREITPELVQRTQRDAPGAVGLYNAEGWARSLSGALHRNQDVNRFLIPGDEVSDVRFAATLPMTPREFLDYSPSLSTDITERNYIDKLARRIEREGMSSPSMHYMLDANEMGMPWIETAHDGRHRMAAASLLGLQDTRLPVLMMRDASIAEGPLRALQRRMLTEYGSKVRAEGATRWAPELLDRAYRCGGVART
jgi:hypothetical protein